MIITNQFHNSECKINPKPILTGKYQGLHLLSRAVWLRLKRSLCGVEGCKCSHVFARNRANTFTTIWQDADKNIIIKLAENPKPTTSKQGKKNGR